MNYTMHVMLLCGLLYVCNAEPIRRFTETASPTGSIESTTSLFEGTQSNKKKTYKLEFLLDDDPSKVQPISLRTGTGLFMRAMMSDLPLARLFKKVKKPEVHDKEHIKFWYYTKYVQLVTL